MIIYEVNNTYYIKQSNLYFICDVTIKNHTIVVTPTSEYIEQLPITYKQYTYQELKDKLLGD